MAVWRGRELVSYLHWCWDELHADIKNDLSAPRNQVARVELGFEDFASGGSIGTDLVHALCAYLPQERRTELVERIVDELPATVLHPKKWPLLGPVLEREAAAHGLSLANEIKRHKAAAIPYALSGLSGRPRVAPIISPGTVQYPSEDATRIGLAAIIRRLLLRERPLGYVNTSGRRAPFVDLDGDELRETLGAPDAGMAALDEVDAVQTLLEQEHYTRQETKLLYAIAAAAGTAKPDDLARVLKWKPGNTSRHLCEVRRKTRPLRHLLRRRS